MAYNFLYIDDMQDTVEKGIINGLNHKEVINVKFQKPRFWEEQLDYLQKEIPSLDGVILDLRLNENPFDAEKFAKYRGSTVAQELRTLAKENNLINDFPIILISANANLEKSFDKTSVDLFDYIISKNDIGSDKLPFDFVKAKLKWLVDGYQFLNKAKKDVESVLQIKDLSILDFRFVDEFRKTLTKPTHVIARFLQENVINKPSFLIDEDYLSARLGVDRSSPGWAELKTNVLKPAIYTGAFSGELRWIMPLIEEWWETQISNVKLLRRLSASERVKLVMEKTGIKELMPLVKSEKSKSSSFWVVCKVTKVPLDTTDGFVIDGQDHSFPWQGLQYVSIDEAMRQTDETAWNAVAPSERDRLQSLIALYSKTQIRVKPR